MLFIKENIFYLVMALIISFFLSFAMTPLVKKLANKVGAVAFPDSVRHIHKTPTERMGGLAIFIGFSFGLFLLPEFTRELMGIFYGAVLLVVCGIVDDIKPLPPLLKLIVQCVAAFLAMSHGVLIEFLRFFLFSGGTLVINLGIFSYLFTLIWIVGVTNAVNLIDGLDGLATSLSAVSAATMLVIAISFRDINVSIILLALIGALLGFLPYNSHPAKIFMGDTGSLFLGFILSTVSIMGAFKLHTAITFLVPFLALALPVIDTVMAFFRRLINKQNPMVADKKHLHHRLLAFGFNQKEVVALMTMASAVLGLFSLTMATEGRIRMIAVYILYVCTSLTGFIIYKTIKTANIRKADTSCSDENMNVQA